jgi:predicted nucleic acid-binding protein
MRLSTVREFGTRLPACSVEGADPRDAEDASPASSHAQSHAAAEPGELAAAAESSDSSTDAGLRRRTSSPTSRRGAGSGVRLVADANVLPSALIGGRARLALTHSSVEATYAAAATLAEVQEYVPTLARKKRLSLDVLLLALAALPVIVVDRAEYERKMPAAARRLGRRDPDDVDVLALALHLGVPVWSNDDDFREAGVEWFTTATLLKRLAYRRRGRSTG